MARLYLDEQLDTEMTAILSALGHDVVHTYDVGNRGAPDSRQLMFAVETGRVLVTLSREDFEELHRWWLALNDWGVIQREHTGILTTWGDIPAEEFSALIDSLLGQNPYLPNRTVRYNRQSRRWRYYILRPPP